MIARNKQTDLIEIGGKAYLRDRSTKEVTQEEIFSDEAGENFWIDSNYRLWTHTKTPKWRKATKKESGGFYKTVLGKKNPSIKEMRELFYGSF